MFNVRLVTVENKISEHSEVKDLKNKIDSGKMPV